MSSVNTEWLKNLKKQIDAIPDCRSLDKLVQQAKEIFAKQIDDATNEIAKLAGLIVPPTSLSKIIKYLKNLANYYLGPYQQAIQKQAELIKAFGEVLKAIEEKRNNLHCSLKPADQFNSFKINLQTLATQKLYSSNPTLASLVSLTEQFNGRVPTLQVIAGQLGVSVESLPTIAAQYGGSIPFVQKMIDKHQYVEIPVAPTVPTITIPSDIPLDNPAPTIDTITPNLGDKNGGISIDISGSNFLEGCTVLFGDAEATIISFGPDFMRVESPAGPEATTVSIKVINPDLQEAVKSFAYTFVTV